MMFRLALVAAALIFATVAQVSAREIPCECRDTYGNLHDIGTEVCLTVGGRTFMARCAMAQNVTIWRDTGGGCPTG